MPISGEKPKFYITTPIYYPNARPHVGSAYTTIACDAIARYKRICGYDVAFLTGTDEHGEKLQRAADAAGVPVEQFVAEKRELFKNLWRTLGISEYRFVHTSQNPDHVKAVHWMIRQANRAGSIEKKKYEGRYCVFDERYVSDSPEPANCDICGRPAELIREENYFFKLSAFQDRLLELYRDHPEFVLPDFRMNEVKSFVKSGLRDISISRRRLKWGIPWPDDAEQVVYVWYDALTSYLTGIGFRGEERSKDFEKYWMGAEGPAEVVHMIGKDIIRFHAVYWPAFLIAAGLPLPKTIFAHGWIYYEQDKMSKSKGNVVYPEPIVQAFNELGAPGNDALRYYLLRDTPFGQDGSFSYEGLIQRYNSDLANDLGNLANRTVTMLNRYAGSRVPEKPSKSPAEDELEIYFFGGARGPGPAPLDLVAPFFKGERARILAEVQSGGGVMVMPSDGVVDSYKASMGNLLLPVAARLVWDGVAKGNGYLVKQEPWKIAESKLDDATTQVGRILYTTADLIRVLAALLHPITPDATEAIWSQLGCEGKIEDQRFNDLKWQGLKPGTKVGKPEPIFPRLDKAKTLARLLELAEADRAKDAGSAGVPPATEPFFSYDLVEARNRGHLPHWEIEGGTYFVTFRLVDSLPRSAVDAIEVEVDDIARTARGRGRGLTSAEQKRVAHLSAEKIEATLDAGGGAAHLAKPEIADLVAGALAHFNGQRYHLLAWCVMPNHVHVLFQQVPGYSLDSILHSWKSFTAKQANMILGQSGEFWEREYYDHLVRDRREIEQIADYVAKNPAKATLKNWRWVWRSVAGSARVSPAERPGQQDAGATPAATPDTSQINIEDFAKVDLRVGQVLTAEPIPGAKKLLKLMVDIGSEVRQVCAGIAEYYDPSQLVGMKVVLVANLAPRKLRGIESNGMIVAASVGENGKPVLATFKEEVPNGARLK